MNPNQKRPVLFVSNYCAHCKQVLAMLSKKGLRSHFLIANVDKHSAQLPSFVQRVPTILTENKEVLVDAGVFSYLDAMAQRYAAVDIQPFYAGDMGNHVSDKYSYIEEGSQSGARRAFGLIGDESYTINTPKEEDFSGNKGSSSMDALMADRENDIKRIIESGAPDGPVMLRK